MTTQGFTYLRPWLARWVRYDWPLGVFLIAFFGVLRFGLVLGAQITGQYNAVSLIFLAMIFLPFVLLNGFGRLSIGLVRAESPRWLFYGFAGGVLAASLFYALGNVLYGDSISNWFYYISRTYRTDTGGPNVIVIFAITALVSMTFSPIGEELFYRGIVHGSLTRRFGVNNASKIDSLAFALTHLAHFGIIYTSGVWTVLPVPALIWVALMYIVSRFFFMCKLKSGSVYAAILAHAGFNLAMVSWTFF